MDGKIQNIQQLKSKVWPGHKLESTADKDWVEVLYLLDEQTGKASHGWEPTEARIAPENIGFFLGTRLRSILTGNQPKKGREMTARPIKVTTISPKVTGNSASLISNCYIPNNKKIQLHLKRKM